jgi:GNAT superfamily N-acetyltransferase
VTDVDIRPVTPERWDDLADLFERRGPRGGKPVTDWCWCMYWRERTHDKAKNKPAMRAIVEEGRQPGLLAYVDGIPVAWVSVGPREEFSQLLRSRLYRPTRDEAGEPGVFTIVCFYVHPSAKRAGLASRLLAAARDYAIDRGARVVEAWPAESFDYMGHSSWFLDAGFAPVRSAGKRTLMRYEP